MFQKLKEIHWKKKKKEDDVFCFKKCMFPLTSSGRSEGRVLTWLNIKVTKNMAEDTEGELSPPFQEKVSETYSKIGGNT